MTELIEKIATALGDLDADRERRAWSIVALMVGAVEIARAMPDGDEANLAMVHAREIAIH